MDEEQVGELTDVDRAALANMMDLGASMAKGVPQSIIDWNEAIDREIAEGIRPRGYHGRRQP